MDTSHWRTEHRAVETALDALEAAFSAAEAVLRARFDDARAAVLAHYAAEDAVLPHMHAALGAKLLRQHEDAREIASMSASSKQELLYLARRFHAAAQHNIIEEERDLFPLAEQ